MAKISIDLQPWTTPNYVQAKSGNDPRTPNATSWPLSDIDVDIIAQLCDDWRAEVFRKAGKPDPAKA